MDSQLLPTDSELFGDNDGFEFDLWAHDRERVGPDDEMSGEETKLEPAPIKQPRPESLKPNVKQLT